MAKRMIAGNWKMYKTADEAQLFMDKLAGMNLPERYLDIVIFPSYLSIPALTADPRVSSMGIRIGAQNGHWEPEGAYTGEVSMQMLREAGCRYVLVGHSERRWIMGETDRDVHRKVNEALRVGLIPVVCVGETAQQRQQGISETVVVNQVKEALTGIDLPEGDRLVIAYEPVWAIGSGNPATPEDASTVHGVIRKQLTEMKSQDWAQAVRILYGGSVKPDNIADFLLADDINGALVGGASLQAQSFVEIIRKAAERG